MIRIVALLMLLAVSPATAQIVQFSGAQIADPGGLSIPAANNVSTNWAKAGLAVIGGIPSRSQCGSTLNPSGLTPPVANDDAALLTAKIAACAAGTKIVLGTGTFNYAQSELPIVVNKSLTITGSGSTTGTCNMATGTACWGTILQTYDGPQPNYTSTPTCGTTLANATACPNGSGMFLVTPFGLFEYGWAGCNIGVTNPQTSGCGTLVANDVAQGATTIQVASTTGFSVGGWMMIDEAPVLGTVTNPVPGQAGIQASADFLTASDTPVVGKIANPDAGLCTYSFCTNRVSEEVHKITAISSTCPGAGCTLTFDSPLIYGFRQTGSHLARAYWPTKQTTNVSNPFVDQVGFENITFNRCNGGCVNFVFASYGWVKNSEFNYWINGAVNVAYSARELITGNYIHDCIDCQNNGVEYPIAIDSASMEVLLEDNIIIRGGKGMVGRAAAGAVVAYNYFDMSFYANSSAIGNWWNDMAANGSHYAGTHHFLFEGNWANNCDGDETHGNAVYHTFFRNQCTGYRSSFVDPSNGLTSDDCAGTGIASGGNIIAITSATYNSATGVIVLSLDTLVPAPTYTSGTTVTLRSLTGTGANIFNLTGTWTSTSVVSRTVTLSGPTGQGTITINGGSSIGNKANSPGPLRAAGPMAFNYWYAYAFNVLGKSGMQSCAGGAFTYSAGTSGFNTNRVMWMSGWTAGEWGGITDANLTTASPIWLFRNGNFNYVNSTVDSASGYASTAPNSLYLSSAPAYFTGAASTWPWVTPGGGTKVFTLPAKARYDSGQPFVSP